MKPIMNLYSDKVTITDKKELDPFAKGKDFVVAGKNGVVYTSVPKDILESKIAAKISIQPSLVLLQAAIAVSKEVIVVPELEIIDDKVSIMATEEATVLMTNRHYNVVIAKCYDKIYTNNVEAANKCMELDLESGDLQAIRNAGLLKTLISLRGGLHECELKVM